jgi:hypothetical protein
LGFCHQGREIGGVFAEVEVSARSDNSEVIQIDVDGGTFVEPDAVQAFLALLRVLEDNAVQGNRTSGRRQSGMDYAGDCNGRG